MNKFLTIAFVLLTSFSLNSNAISHEITQPTSSIVKNSEDRLQRIYEASCRVSVVGGIGTGTIIGESNTSYFVLTNAHVVGRSNSANIEFTKSHYPSPKISGKVIGRKLIAGGSFDVAIVAVPKSSLNGVKLPVIPLAKRGEQPRNLKYLTCGCQAGEMPSLQQVLTSRIDNKLIYYKPPARSGRSGSSLVDVNSNRVYGLVAWTNGEEGLAMTADVIRDWVESIDQGTTSRHEYKETVSFNDQQKLPEGFKVIPLSATDASYEDGLRKQQCDPNSPWCNEQDEAGIRDWLRRRRPSPNLPNPLPQNPLNPQNPFNGNPQPNAPDLDFNDPWSGENPDFDTEDPFGDNSPDLEEPELPNQPDDRDFEDKVLDQLDNLNKKADKLLEDKVGILDRDRSLLSRIGGFFKRAEENADERAEDIKGSTEKLIGGGNLVNALKDTFKPLINFIRFVVRWAAILGGLGVLVYLFVPSGTIGKVSATVVKRIWATISSFITTLRTPTEPSEPESNIQLQILEALKELKNERKEK